MVCILGHGDTHFIVRGPLRTQEVALALIRHWSLIQIGSTTPPPLDRWHISHQESLENLELDVVVPGKGEICRSDQVVGQAVGTRNHHPRGPVWALAEQPKC
jgi:hypothetical protein